MRSLGDQIFDSDKFLEGSRQGKRTDIFIDGLTKHEGAQTEFAMGFAEQFSNINSGHTSTERRFDVGGGGGI
jgi:hypothetical protein